MKAIKYLQHRIALYEDTRAYKELYMLLFDGLYKFSYSLIKSHEVAEEIVSDAFIKVWQMRDQLQHVDNLTVYLYTIARNLSLNYISKHSKNPCVHLNEENMEAVIEFKSPEDLFISQETMRRFDEVVRRLPPQCGMIFRLIREEGLKYKEVAAILNISVFTVRNQMTIATRRMGEALTSSHSSTRSDCVMPHLHFGIPM